MEKKMHKENDSCLQISSGLLYTKKCSETYACPKDETTASADRVYKKSFGSLQEECSSNLAIASSTFLKIRSPLSTRGFK